MLRVKLPICLAASTRRAVPVRIYLVLLYEQVPAKNVALQLLPSGYPAERGAPCVRDWHIMHACKGRYIRDRWSVLRILYHVPGICVPHACLVDSNTINTVPGTRYQVRIYDQHRVHSFTAVVWNKGAYSSVPTLPGPGFGDCYLQHVMYNRSGTHVCPG